MSTAMTRTITQVVGVLFLGLGVLGFVPGAPFIPGLAADPTHNFAHIMVGLLILWAGRTAHARAGLMGAALLFAILMLAPGAALTATALYFASALVTGYAAFGEEGATTTA